MLLLKKLGFGPSIPTSSEKQWLENLLYVRLQNLLTGLFIELVCLIFCFLSMFSCFLLCMFSHWQVQVIWISLWGGNGGRSGVRLWGESKNLTQEKIHFWRKIWELKIKCFKLIVSCIHNVMQLSPLSNSNPFQQPKGNPAPLISHSPFSLPPAPGSTSFTLYLYGFIFSEYFLQI